jgi:hypothetical protein
MLFVPPDLPAEENAIAKDAKPAEDLKTGA